MQYAPPSSALARATDPDVWITPEVQMLREVHHAVEVLSWMKTDGATKKPPTGYPERLPLTAGEVRAHKDAQPPVMEALPIDEMHKWLGWPDRTPKEAR